MKKLLILSWAVIGLGYFSAYAQAPQGIQYQAVARDANGVISGDSVEVRLTIFSGISPVYQEIHETATNEFGLFNLVIGQGATTLGSFSGLDWADNDHFLEVELDLGSGYLNFGSLQFVSVPYSLYAEKARTVEQVSLALDDLSDVSSPAPGTDQVLRWNGSEWLPSTDLVDDADADPSNELQTLSLNGADLSLSSGGGTVSLPVYSAGQGINLGANNEIQNTGDLDSTNELQSLSLNGSNLSLSDGGSVTLPEYSAGPGITITPALEIQNTGDTDPNDDLTTSTSAGGDLGGTFPNPNVIALQGQPLANTPPSNGQVLKWTGTEWSPATDIQGQQIWSTSGNNIFYNAGRVGIGTSSIDAEMEIFHNSSLSDPHLLLHENANDYARLNWQNNNGSNYWSLAAYVASNPRNDRFNVWNGSQGDILSITGDGEMGLNVGISPKVSFHVGEDNRMLFGKDTLGNGDKLMWLPDLHAFRVGTLSSGAASTYWNRDSIGQYSFASGYNTRAQGFGATAMGRDTEATNSYAFASGYFTNADGQYSTAMGFNTDALALGSTALGYSTDAEANYSFAAGFSAEAQAIYSVAIGRSVRAQSYASMAIGRFNVGGGSANSWQSSDPIFEIGIGSSNSNRANAMTVRKNGNVGIGTTLPGARLHVAGGELRIGSLEELSDGGSFLLQANSILAPLTNGNRSLGTSSFRWSVVFATNGTINTSDLRDKQNVLPIQYGLQEVLELRPVSYEWKAAPEEGTKLGLIAQEVQKVVSEVVVDQEWMTDEESGERRVVPAERLGIFYSDLIPVLIRATQEQQALIEQQNQRIEALEEEMRAIRALLEQK